MSESGNDVKLFTYACDFKELPFTLVSELEEIAFNPFFQESDLVIFHFGVFSPLFNLLPIIPKDKKSVVVFHNITPKQHLSVSAHETIDRSFAQMSNIVFANHVVCDSQTNQNVLHEAGIYVNSTVLPLALHSNAKAPLRKPSFDDSVTRVLFVGRFVKSKGPVDLLNAASAVLKQNAEAIFCIDMVGNLLFSDADVVSDIKALMSSMKAQFKERLVVALHGNASEALKNQLLADADIFVLPTRHEGFCVPILEAFANACCVVTYDNSNTPSISGGLAQLIPTGDVELLAKALAKSVDLTCSADWITGGSYERYCKKTEDHCRQFSPATVKRRFLRLVSEVCSKPDQKNRA
jgi:glycosyltransferase involved in cell wall biosynthesis